MYTSVPRPILWLVPGGDHRVLDVGGYRSGEVVEIEPFYLSKLPVSNEQFEAFDPAFDRAPESPEDRDPAVGVTWEEAVEYCRWYAALSRKPMRLPTELEWEYACTGGEEGVAQPTPDQVEALAWHRANTADRLPSLEAKEPNSFGLYGLLGGLWEWTLVESAESRGVLRGGSWREAPELLRPSLRAEAELSGPDWTGFRVAKPFRS